MTGFYGEREGEKVIYYIELKEKKKSKEGFELKMREGKETVFQLRRGTLFSRHLLYRELQRLFFWSDYCFFASFFSSFDSLINCFLMTNLLPKLLPLILYQTVLQPNK